MEYYAFPYSELIIRLCFSKSEKVGRAKIYSYSFAMNCPSFVKPSADTYIRLQRELL